MIGYDPAKEWLFTDRSQSGVTDFHPAFASRHGASLAAVNGQLRLQLWLDRNAVEVYADNGLVVLTDQIFPESPIEHIEVRTQSGQVVVNSLQIHKLDAVQIPYVSTVQPSRRNEA
ncbi:Levanase precursor [compost metagenome]